jgi:hypothetical protein
MYIQKPLPFVNRAAACIEEYPARRNKLAAAVQYSGPDELPTFLS